MPLFIYISGNVVAQKYDVRKEVGEKIFTHLQVIEYYRYLRKYDESLKRDQVRNVLSFATVLSPYLQN